MIRKLLDEDFATDFTNTNLHLVANMHSSCKFDPITADQHLAGFNRGLCQAASLEKPRSPQPLVDPDISHRCTARG